MSTTPSRVALAVAAIVVAGCGPQPHFVEVSGHVLSGGEPLDGVVVTFVPVAEGFERYTSSAVTDGEGAFRLKCVNGHSGAMVGRHRVTVEDLRPYRAPRNDEPPADAKQFASRVARSYNAVSQTPLSVEIAPDQDDVTLVVEP